VVVDADDKGLSGNVGEPGHGVGLK